MESAFPLIINPPLQQQDVADFHMEMVQRDLFSRGLAFDGFQYLVAGDIVKMFPFKITIRGNVYDLSLATGPNNPAIYNQGFPVRHNNNNNNNNYGGYPGYAPPAPAPAEYNNNAFYHNNPPPPPTFYNNPPVYYNNNNNNNINNNINNAVPNSNHPALPFVPPGYDSNMFAGQSANPVYVPPGPINNNNNNNNNNINNNDPVPPPPLRRRQTAEVPCNKVLLPYLHKIKDTLAQKLVSDFRTTVDFSFEGNAVITAADSPSPPDITGACAYLRSVIDNITYQFVDAKPALVAAAIPRFPFIVASEVPSSSQADGSCKFCLLYFLSDSVGVGSFLQQIATEEKPFELTYDLKEGIQLWLQSSFQKVDAVIQECRIQYKQEIDPKTGVPHRLILMGKLRTDVENARNQLDDLFFKVYGVKVELSISSNCTTEAFEAVVRKRLEPLDALLHHPQILHKCSFDLPNRRVLIQLVTDSDKSAVDSWRAKLSEDIISLDDPSVHLDMATPFDRRLLENCYITIVAGMVNVTGSKADVQRCLAYLNKGQQSQIQVLASPTIIQFARSHPTKHPFNFIFDAGVAGSDLTIQFPAPSGQPENVIAVILGNANLAFAKKASIEDQLQQYEYRLITGVIQARTPLEYRASEEFYENIKSQLEMDCVVKTNPPPKETTIGSIRIEVERVGWDKLQVDALVVPMNPKFDHSGGLGKLLAAKFPAIVKQCKDQFQGIAVETGGVFVTNTMGGPNDIRHVIEAVIPSLKELDHCAKLRNCVGMCLEAAANSNCSSLALVGLGAVHMGYSPEKSASLMVCGIREWIAQKQQQQQQQPISLNRIVLFDILEVMVEEFHYALMQDCRLYEWSYYVKNIGFRPFAPRDNDEFEVQCKMGSSFKIKLQNSGKTVLVDLKKGVMTDRDSQQEVHLKRTPMANVVVANCVQIMGTAEMIAKAQQQVDSLFQKISQQREGALNYTVPKHLLQEVVIIATKHGCEFVSLDGKKIVAKALSQRHFDAMVATINLWADDLHRAGGLYVDAAWSKLLVHVSRSSQEYRDVVAKLLQQQPKLQVTNLQTIQNSELYKRYTNVRLMIETASNGANEEVLLLYGAGPAVDPKDIAKTGLDLREQKIGTFGKALEFSDNFGFMNGRRFELSGSSAGQSQLLIVQVARGRVEKKAAADNKLKKPSDGFDCIEGPLMPGVTGTMLYQNFQSYPLYIVTYKNI